MKQNTKKIIHCLLLLTYGTAEEKEQKKINVCFLRPGTYKKIAAESLDSSYSATDSKPTGIS
jgi:hypothetical protein